MDSSIIAQFGHLNVKFCAMAAKLMSVMCGVSCYTVWNTPFLAEATIHFPSKRTSTSSRTKFCHLQTPEKAQRHKNMKTRTNTAERHLKKLKEKFNRTMESPGCVELDDQMNSDLL